MVAKVRGKLTDHVAIASVMASWQGVFRAIQIAQGTYLRSLTDAPAAMAASHEPSTSTAEAEAQPPDSALSAMGTRQVPDTLVRIPIQAPTSTSAADA